MTSSWRWPRSTHSRAWAALREPGNPNPGGGWPNCEVGCRAGDGGRVPPAHRAQPLPSGWPCVDMPTSSLALLSLHLSACCGAFTPGAAWWGHSGFAATPLLAEPSGTIHTSGLVSDLPVPATRPPGGELDWAEFAKDQVDNFSTPAGHASGGTAKARAPEKALSPTQAGGHTWE